MEEGRDYQKRALAVAESFFLMITLKLLDC